MSNNYKYSKSDSIYKYIKTTKIEKTNKNIFLH